MPALGDVLETVAEGDQVDDMPALRQFLGEMEDDQAVAEVQRVGRAARNEEDVQGWSKIAATATLKIGQYVAAIEHICFGQSDDPFLCVDGKRLAPGIDHENETYTIIEVAFYLIIYIEIIIVG